MAETEHSPQGAHDSQGEREQRIDLRPFGWRRWDIEGTRAQLEADGAIPPGTQWPAGVRRLTWTAGPLEFELRRTRPAGMKGPMRLWVEGDWWLLVCTQVEREHPVQTEADNVRRELERLTYLQSPAGQREHSEQWRRYWKARDDKAFQSFKALIPGLNPPRRGRRAAGAA